MSTTTVTASENILTIKRTIDAPVDKVWDAWTKADIFAKWWGPTGWDTEVKELNFKIDGNLLYGMKCNDERQTDWFGKTSWGKSVYTDIKPKTEFTYVDYFCDADGNVDAQMPAPTVTVSLHEADGKTEMISTGVYTNKAALDQVLAMGMEEGIKMTIDRLADLFE